MFSLLLGLVLFLGIHSISIIAPLYREKCVIRNDKLYKAVYSLASFLGIYFIATGFSALRTDPSLIYIGNQSLRPLVYLVMLLAFILFFTPYFPGKIKQVTKNPQLLSVIFWAFAHLLVNGNLADILLFGSFLVWAIIDLFSMRNRQQRVVSPFKHSWVNDVIVIVLGTVVCGFFMMFLHGYLIGIPIVG
ncbi:NnrU family protein [Vibrio sp. FNV 38]|nr:NnrU family protein [Vibrio sp. FNV 38]